MKKIKIKKLSFIAYSSTTQKAKGTVLAQLLIIM